MTNSFTRIIVTFNEAVAPPNVYEDRKVLTGLTRCLETQGSADVSDKGGNTIGLMTEVYILPKGVRWDDEDVDNIRAGEIQARLQEWCRENYPNSQVRRNAEDYPWYGDRGPKAPHFIIEPTFEAQREECLNVPT